MLKHQYAEAVKNRNIHMWAVAKGVLSKIWAIDMAQRQIDKWKIPNIEKLIKWSVFYNIRRNHCEGCPQINEECKMCFFEFEEEVCCES